MFPPADLADLLVHELASLGARRFPRSLVLAGLRDCSLLRHHHSPLRPVSLCDPIPRGAVVLAWAPVAYGVNACAINLIPPRRGRRSLGRGVFGVDVWLETQMNILTVNLVFSTVVFAVAAKLYLIPMLPRLEPRSVVLPILLLHALRHLGLMFLASGAVFGMPARFAYPATVGDLIAAVLALIALCAVVRRSRFARPLVALFNVEGTLDLVLAISLATVYRAAPHMGPAYWIPAFWVPALLVTHYVVFVVLGRRWTGPM